ncbi:MAG: eukaryotic-like serine/threonine-protein kinase [Actinomycetota bacterium]|jgi:serine/threonine-protein kinase|nr:eukaryotic-like serine/threonine-protein kinase [Actinomycetota bacterium]
MSSDIDVVAKRYELEAPIASGGMATVWRATDTVLARRVAVKILHAQLSGDEAFLERFRREALAAARLTHPNIVAIYDTGSDARTNTNDQRQFIVMEYCSGGSLQQVVEREGRLDADRVVDIGVSICDALEYAHRLEIIHRDIKPGNVLVAEDGALKVGDFGIAKAAFVSGDITTTGNILGTVTYISPEQARGEEPDARSDLYSLGIVLYQLLLGRPPFAAETQIGTAMKHLQEAPAPPRSIKAGIPKALEAVIMKSLQKQPQDRFSSASEMRTALQESASGGRTTVMRAMQRPATVSTGAPARTPSTSSLAAFRWLIPVLLAIAAVIALALYLPGLIGGTDNKPGHKKTTASGGGNPSGVKPLPVAHITAFDPEGDGSEHQELTGAVTDGNPATGWHTQTYNSPLQGQKPGVGLLFDLGSNVTVNGVRIASQTPGYAFELRAGNQPGASEASFGVVKTIPSAAGNQSVTFAAATHRYWLLWITALPGGGGGTAYINEVKFFGPSS